MKKTKLDNIILEELTKLLNEAPPKPWKPKRGKGTTMGLKPPRGLKPPIRPTTPTVKAPVVPPVATGLAGLEKLDPTYLKQLGIKEPPVAGPTQPDLQARGIVEPYGRLYKQPAAKYLGTKEGPGELVDLNAIKDEVAQYLSQYYTPATEQLPASAARAIAGEATGPLGTAVEDVKAGMTPEEAAEALKEFDPMGLVKWKQREDYLAAVDLKAREIMASGGLNRMQMAAAEMGLGTKFDRDVISRLSKLARPLPGEAGEAAMAALQSDIPYSQRTPEQHAAEAVRQSTLQGEEAMASSREEARRATFHQARERAHQRALQRVSDLEGRLASMGRDDRGLYNALKERHIENELIEEPMGGERSFRPYSRSSRRFIKDYIEEYGNPAYAGPKGESPSDESAFEHMQRFFEENIHQSRRDIFAQAWGDRFLGNQARMIYDDLAKRGELPAPQAQGSSLVHDPNWMDKLEENKLQYVVEEEYQKLLLELKR